MPTVVIEGYKCRFYSSDVAEPPHVHVLRAGHVAKVWLSPVRVEHNYGYSRDELSRILRLLEQYQSRLLEEWNGYFGR